MKRLFTCLFIFTIGASVTAQIPDIKEKPKCYEKIGPDGKTLTKDQQRYAEWECGKLAGVSDCGNDLTYDEATNTVYREITDFSNISGANKPFNGQCESCFMNGVLQRRVTFVDGKEDGTDTTYYQTGCPQVVRTHVRGVEHGQWIYYHDSTDFYAWEMNYNMGEKHGRQIYFAKPIKDKNGRMFQDTIKWENYNMGILDGVKRTYYKRSPDGEEGGGIKREVNYKQGIMHGSFKIYNLERVVIQEVNYNQGKKDKEATYYYDDGKLLKTESWDMDVRNGEFKTFYYQGHIQTSENYKKGKREGWFEDFYPDQTSKRRRLFEKDELVEEHRYDEHGRETYTFGAQSDNGAEDDEVPGGKKKKKKKK